MDSWAKTGLNPKVPCAGVRHVPEHWKIRETLGPLLLMWEVVGGSGYI